MFPYGQSTPGKTSPTRLHCPCRNFREANHDAKAEAPIVQPPDAKSRLIRKDPDAGKDWRQEEKGTTEDEMVGWHHRLSGHGFEQALGDVEGQGSLECHGSRGPKESDTTEQVNNNNHVLHCCPPPPPPNSPSYEWLTAQLVAYQETLSF